MITRGLERADTFVESGPPSAADDPTEPGDDAPGIIYPPRISGSQADWQKAVLHEKHEKERLSRYTVEGMLLEWKPPPSVAWTPV